MNCSAHQARSSRSSSHRTFSTREEIP
jgi:hypothetical protein